MILKFGKFKGEKFEDTPVWYQNWLNNQDWFNGVKWGVFYKPTREGRLFAGLKNELEATFKTKDEAFAHCQHLNMAGSLDELHDGYIVRAVYK